MRKQKKRRETKRAAQTDDKNRTAKQQNKMKTSKLTGAPAAVSHPKGDSGV
jgi:hypothetical protein